MVIEIGRDENGFDPLGSRPVIETSIRGGEKPTRPADQVKVKEDERPMPQPAKEGIE